MGSFIKRVILFIIVNLAIMLLVSVVFNLTCNFFDLDMASDSVGVIAIWALLYGMIGSFVSLLLSKPIAKWLVKAKTITGNEGEAERWLVDTVRSLAMMANIRAPEVAIYEGEANAFATGAFKNRALVAVSSEIMEKMTREELRAVLGHEISHVANGDMVTMSLLQGVLNACVLFLSRIIAYVTSEILSDKESISRVVYYIIYYAAQILLSILASIIVMWYSRRREFAADLGSAKLIGSPASMIAALRRLNNLQPGVLPNSLKAFGISGKRASLFSSHPSIEDRIAALERMQIGKNS